MDSILRITVRFFASLREITAIDRIEIDLPHGSGSGDVMRALKDDLDPDALAAIEGDQVKVAVNQVILRTGQNLNEGDEVAFLQPITGG